MQINSANRRQDKKEGKQAEKDDRKAVEEAAKAFNTIRGKVNALSQKTPASSRSEDEKAELEELYRQDDNARKNYEQEMADYRKSHGKVYTGGGIDVDRGGQKKPATGKTITASPAKGGTATKGFNALPEPGKLSGKTVTDHQTGKKYKSNGTKWIPVPEA
jgi:hypothetical protein